MSEESTHTGTGRWIALATAVVTLVAAAVSAGLIHANGDSLPVQNVVTSVSASTPGPAPTSTISTTSRGTTWRSDAADLCTTAQDYLDDHYGELMAMTTWHRLAFFGQAVKVLDSSLKQVEAPTDVQARIQLMVQNWDTAADALVRAGDAADRGDLAQAYADKQAFEGPNGRGNQIADDLGLTACADLTLG